MKFCLLITIVLLSCKAVTTDKRIDLITNKTFLNYVLSVPNELSLPIVIKEANCDYPQMKDSLREVLKNNPFNPQWELPLAKLFQDKFILILCSNECCQGNMVDVLTFSYDGLLISKETINYESIEPIKESCITTIEKNLEIKSRYKPEAGDSLDYDKNYIDFEVNKNGQILKKEVK